ADGPASPNGGAPRVSPEARRLAEERNVDLSKVTGTGPAGRIMAADVEQAIAQPTAEPAPSPARPPARAPAPGAQSPARSAPASPAPSTQPSTPAREERARMS